MAAKVFVDTNILMDLLCHRDHMMEAATIIDMGKRGEVELFCTALTIANCIYNCRKTLGKEIVHQIMKSLCTFIRVSPIGQNESDKAFLIENPDFEDALQNFSAESIHADVIITRNPKHFRYSSIPVMSGAEYLEQL